MMVGSAWAYNSAEHVSQAPNGEGDLIIIPQYMAVQGWNTKITVVNTCLETSVVAKVIVRSGGYTKELLDFFIFLSPADVWSGDINYGPNGPRIISYDDSVIRNANLEFADANNAFTADFQPVCDSDVVGGNGGNPDWSIPGNQVGYVTIIEAWHFGGTWGGVNYGAPGVRKSDVMKAFFTETGWGSFAPSQRISGLEETANVLAAHYEISSAASNLYAINQATILQNFNVVAPITIGLETRMDGVDSQNSLCEVEAALSKSRVVVPYYAGESGKATVSWMTFPTKYTQVTDCAATGVLSPFFTANAISTSYNPYSLEYGLKYFDMSENSPTSSNFTSPVSPSDQYFFPYEVNILSKILKIAYNQGWANIEFADNTTYTTSCDTDENPQAAVSEVMFYGAPAIPTTMYIGSGQMGMMEAAWKNGWVYMDETVDGVGGVVADTYNPLYQVDWTKVGYYADPDDGDGIVNDSRADFCEATPVIPNPLP
jgi:hypothetical protein